MGRNDEALERNQRRKQESLGSTSAVERLEEAKEFEEEASRAGGEVTTDTSGLNVETMMDRADIGDGPQFTELGDVSEGEAEYAQILDEASETFEYMREGEFVEEKVNTFMLYDEFSGLYGVTDTIMSDPDLQATEGQVFEWTNDMVETYDLLEETGEGLEYTEKGEKVYDFLDR